jgi:hypothetical protein
MSMKRHYWADRLRTLANKDDNIIGLWKKIMVWGAIYSISQAWSYVNPVMLVRSWRKLLPDLEEDVRFEVLTAPSTKMAVFCVVALCSLVENYQCFRGICCVHHEVPLKRR